MLCAAGVDVLAFDYRGFGLSGGGNRQSVSMLAQVEDYHAAVDAAKALPDVDPTRVALWGVSLAGGHVMSVAAARRDIAAAIALTPLVDGWAAAALALRHYAWPSLIRCAWAGVRSRVSTARGGDPVTIPLVGPPGHDAAINLSGAYQRYTSVAGPSWRNEVGAAVSFELLRYRPVRRAETIRCRMLVQIGDSDRSAPPHAAAKCAAAAGAELRRYEADHFDVWPGGKAFHDTMADQQRFLKDVFASTDADGPESSPRRG